MADKQFNARIRWKRDTSANWTTNNPVLLNGEIIIVDTDSGEMRFKIGDGVKTYTQLPFEDEAVRNLINNTFEAALPKSGGTMTGTLTLSADPTNDLDAATKQYVDSSTPDVATTTTDGLMSASDKSKLDGIATGATAISIQIVRW